MQTAGRFRSEWRISSWVAVRHWDLYDDEEVVERPFFIYASIAPCLAEPFGRRQLLDLWAAATGRDLQFRWAGDAAHIGRRIEEAFRSGTLVVVRPRRARAAAPGGAAPTRDDAPAPEAQAPAPRPPASKPPPAPLTTWIKFQVLDDETGQPVQGVVLAVKLPDGTTKKSTTDASGMIEITGIPPGTCDIESMIDSDALEVISLA